MLMNIRTILKYIGFLEIAYVPLVAGLSIGARAKSIIAVKPKIKLII